MDREIKFRGKTKHGAWVYGSIGTYKLKFGGKLICDNNVIFQDVGQFQTDKLPYIIEDYSVMEDTIGQYTGLKDKNGKEIYEGDILALDSFVGDQRFICKWNNIHARFELDEVKLLFGAYWSLAMSDSERIEVLGNIHDNPELLKKD